MRTYDQISVFDLHCDTLSRCLETGEPLTENSGRLDLARGSRLGRWTQTFACFLSDQDRGEAAFQKFLAMRQLLLDSCAAHPEQITLWQPGSEPAPGVCAAVLAVEGGQALAGRLDYVERLARLGVRFLTLVWNGDNELASGAVGGLERGLTAFGEQCLYELERTGIVPDISHLNDLGIEDVFTLAKKPVIATHSNLRSVQDNPRNLTEEQFRYLVASGGLCGLNYHIPFVSGGDDYQPEALRRHLDRMLALGGERTVALGSDFDGAAMPSFLKDVLGLYRLYACVVEWYGEALAHRIFSQNAADFTARLG